MDCGGGIDVNGVGIASTEYARRTRSLIRLITELRALGAQTDIDLPRIAVIGNQSAGKSSLVEAISGITVPRASGTCTRCPMECRLQNSSGQWECQILLRFEREENGQRTATVQEKKFGPVLTDKATLEDMLRRAQLAILNPSVPYQTFVDFDLSTVVAGQPPAGSTRLLQFSSNIVCLDLSGPDVVDLSFIDLPGIISNVADGEDRSNIDLVRSLVKEHIEGNALILLTLTMRDDLENQSAAFLAKEADPEGLRTIGVLTKADAILPGEESNWLQVLEGERHALTHGYYVTKQPGPEELSERLTHREAREREAKFFTTTPVWQSSSARVKSRTGIPNLTTELSRLLSQLIAKTLPTLRKDAQKSRDENKAALAQLPPPLPENPVIELLRLLTAFTRDINQWINGEEKHEALLQYYRSASAGFRLNILRTTPDFRPFENSEESLNTDSGFHTEIEDDPLDDHDAPETSPIFLSEIRDCIQRSLTRELPFNVPYSAKRALIEKSFATWKTHASVYFETVCQAAVERLNIIIEDHFSRFAMSPLQDHVQNIIDNQVSQHRKATESQISWFLHLESPPFTQNSHYLSSLRDKYLTKYKAARRGPALDESSVADALAALAIAGFTGLNAVDLQKLNPPDKYEEELIVMAEVSAYVRIAYKRAIDDIPRMVNHDFLLSLGKNIQDALTNEVGIGSANAQERAAMYLAEDPSIVEKRKALLGNKERLEAVTQKLFTFGIPN